MELKGEEQGVTVYDDFAHHPTAIELTLGGLRNKVGEKRILAVLGASLCDDEARRSQKYFGGFIAQC